jgi:hypothetical protein
MSPTLHYVTASQCPDNVSLQANGAAQHSKQPVWSDSTLDLPVACAGLAIERQALGRGLEGGCICRLPACVAGGSIWAMTSAGTAAAAAAASQAHEEVDQGDDEDGGQRQRDDPHDGPGAPPLQVHLLLLWAVQRPLIAQCSEGG